MSRASALSIAVRLAVLTPCLATIVAAPFLGPYVLAASVVALVSAVVIGAPTLWVATRYGVRGVAGFIGVGALAGAVPFSLVAVVAVVFWGGVDSVLRNYVFFGTVTGAATGLVYWVVFEFQNWSRTTILAAVAATVGVAVLVGMWPAEWWPKRQERVAMSEARKLAARSAAVRGPAPKAERSRAG